MKSKLFITCVCLGMLGSTISCAGEDEATQADAESATQSESADDQAAAAKPTRKDKRPSGLRKGAKAAAAEAIADHATKKRAKLTNADCFPKSVPDSAHSHVKLCIILANSAPNMLFPKSDYDRMPEECKPIVLDHCR